MSRSRYTIRPFGVNVNPTGLASCATGDHPGASRGRRPSDAAVHSAERTRDGERRRRDADDASSAPFPLSRRQPVWEHRPVTTCLPRCSAFRPSVLKTLGSSGGRVGTSRTSRSRVRCGPCSSGPSCRTRGSWGWTSGPPVRCRRGGGLHRRRSRAAARCRRAATSRAPAGRSRGVRPRGAGARHGAVRGRADRAGRGRLARGGRRTPPRSYCPSYEPLDGGDRRGSRRRRRRASAVAGPRHERRERVRGGLGRRCARGCRGGGRGPVREPAARAGADGDERDRRRARARRRRSRCGCRPRCPSTCATTSPTRSGSRRTRCARSRPTSAAGSARSCRSTPSTWRSRRPRCSAGRPVRWVETRSESMLGLTHGRAQVQRVEIGARRDGTIVGLRADLLADMGAYPIGAFLPVTTQEMLSGVYAIPRDRVPRQERRHERDPDRAVSRRRPARGDRADRARDRPGGEPSSAWTRPRSGART